MSRTACALKIAAGLAAVVLGLPAAFVEDLSRCAADVTSERIALQLESPRGFFGQ